MTSIQPELWVESPREALAFYEAAFGAKVLHLVGEGDDIVAQIGVRDAAFWIASDYPAAKVLRAPRTLTFRADTWVRTERAGREP